ncbi:MAG: glycerol-3-phosphate acyltransferase, partial [Dehalococcoidales bacterium]|nr:glycerol-3-phosphate acyltransferase [Dehalococcoidales bacterium]
MPVYLWQLILASYLLGSVPAAYIAANRSKGIDLRDLGSGNVGASNLMRFTSRSIAIPVILFDFVKGSAFLLFAEWLGFSLGSQMAVGIAAVCGHNWPIFLRFKGGRGVITTAAVVFAAASANTLSSWGNIASVVIALSTVVGVSVLFKRGPTGVLVGIASIPILAWILGAPTPFILGCFGLFGIFLLRRLTAPQPVKVHLTNRR